MNIDFIVSPVVGGIIGGFANWLAIQMLFFPLTEKRIFGFKVPFTPGIVPKERKRIAQSVGETVSSYFLSEEVIVNAVISPEMEKQFESYIKEVIYTKKDSDETIGQFIKGLSGKNENEIITIASPYICSFIQNQLTSQEFLNELTKYISHYIDELSDKKISDIFSSQQVDVIEENLADKFFEILNEEKIREYISEKTSTSVQKLLKSKHKVKDIVPNELLNELKVKAVVNSDKVAAVISDYITSSSVQFKLRKTLRNKFDESFKLRMVSKVVDVEKIFEAMMTEIFLFLEHSDSHKEIGNFIVQWIDKTSESKIKDLFENLDMEINNLSLNEITLRIFECAATKGNIKNVIQTLISNAQDRTIREIAEQFDVTLFDNKDQLIQNFLVENINKLSGAIVSDITQNNLQKILDMKISKLIGVLGERHIATIQEVVIDNFKKLIRAESDRIIRILDVAKIVEDRINAFDIGEMEEIMIGIIKKDIITMRIFEAGIGFLIGFIIPVYPYVIRYIQQMIR